MGVCLFVMLHGVLPFAYSVERMQAQQQVELQLLHGRMLRQEFFEPTSRATAISNPCYRLLLRLLEPDPRRRITTQQLFLEPWVAESLPPGTVEFNRSVIRAMVAPPQDKEAIRSVLQHVVQSPR